MKNMLVKKVIWGLLAGVIVGIYWFTPFFSIVGNFLLPPAIVVFLFFRIAIILKKKFSKGNICALIGCGFLYLVLGATLPYLEKPEVSSEAKKTWQAKDFYGDKISPDRARIIEDNGLALEERIRMIANAKERVILCTFDFHSDEQGKQVIAALKKAAERGVQVQILMDGFNSCIHMEGDAYFYALAAQKNVSIKLYNELNAVTPWTAMSRMHDKYLIVDESAYLLGGRNTFGYFLGTHDGYQNYDREVFVYNTGGKNSSLYQLEEYFESVWSLSCCKNWKKYNITKYGWKARKAEKELDSLYESMKREKSTWFEVKNYKECTVETKKITLLHNPIEVGAKEPWVLHGLTELMKQAKYEVLLHTPYIICDENMYQSLIEANKNSTITIMTNSARNNGNPFGAVDYVMNKEKILDTGVLVREFDGGVSYHGKSMTVDDDIAIVGSYNLDMKSTYQDTEIMLVVHSEELNQELKSYLTAYHGKTKVTEEEPESLYAEDMRIGEKIQKTMIRIFNPVIRFLL